MTAASVAELEAVRGYCARYPLPPASQMTMGDPSWCSLADDDPVKLAVVVATGLHFWGAERGLALPCWPVALGELVDQRVEEIMREVSHDIANGADWTKVVTDMRVARIARQAREAQRRGDAS